MIKAIGTDMRPFVFTYLLLVASNHTVAENDNKSRLVLATHASASASVDSLEAMSPHQVDPVLSCILDHMGYSFEVYNLPWARAKRELQRGTIDGIFLTASNELLPGIHTNPIYLDRWMAYGINKTSFSLEGNRIGTLRGSNLSEWVATQKTSSLMTASSIEQLVGLLRAGRFDYFVANYEQVEVQTIDQINTEDLSRFFVKYQAKGVTFSLPLLQQKPEFIADFNDYVTSCNPSITQLNDIEKNEISSYMHHVVLGKVTPEISLYGELLAEQTKNLSTSEITDKDNMWKQAFVNQQPQAFIDNLLNNNLSMALKKIQANSPNIVELFVTDSKGVLLGASVMTSDYYQGDESKIIALANTESFISDAHFDSSTRHFQVHFSIRIPEANGLILVAGLTLENLIIRSSHTED